MISGLLEGYNTIYRLHILFEYEAYCKGSYMSQHLVHIVKFESHAQMSGRLQNKQNVNTGFCISLVISNFFFYLKPVVPYQAARGRRSPRRLPWRT